METNIPRIVIAGTGSGCGKTTVSCAVLQAMVNRGLKTNAFKCGPDYIDPMFHSRIIGTGSSNLDSFFFSEETLKHLMTENGKDSDINIIEGVMGFYDGMSMSSVKSSTYDISQITESPVLLVVDAKGAALSIMAVIQGFLTLFPKNRICGAVLNRCSEGVYKFLAPEIEKYFNGKVEAFGYLKPLPDCSIESRHLGLVTADEIKDLRKKLDILASEAEKTIEIDKILKTAKAAPPIICNSVGISKQKETVRIAVAMDEAFCFYYRDNFRILENMGAELVKFSPIHDDKLPENVHGIYFGGGYPELYGEKLSGNTSMKSSVRNALENKVPCIAECGGFMYLSETIGEYLMVGYLPGKCYNTGKLTRFGYVTIKAKNDNLMCKAGEEIKAHEFHYWDSSCPGEDFYAEKSNGKHWDCIYADENLYAGYPHIHFYANMSFAENFFKACLKEKHRYD